MHMSFLRGLFTALLVLHWAGTAAAYSDAQLTAAAGSGSSDVGAADEAKPLAWRKVGRLSALAERRLHVTKTGKAQGGDHPIASIETPALMAPGAATAPEAVVSHLSPLLRREYDARGPPRRA